MSNPSRIYLKKNQAKREKRN